MQSLSQHVIDSHESTFILSLYARIECSYFNPGISAIIFLYSQGGGSAIFTGLRDKLPHVLLSSFGTVHQKHNGIPPARKTKRTVIPKRMANRGTSFWQFPVLWIIDSFILL